MVRGHKFEVIGDGNVVTTDGKGHDGKKCYLLSVGERFGLKAREKLWSGLKHKRGLGRFY